MSTYAYAQQIYEFDVLLKGGHVIDGRNKISTVRDVAVKDGKVAAVASNVAASRALKTVDASGLYVTPGLIDIHVHMYPGPKKNDYAGGDWSVYPDGFTLRSCVTTVADAGSSGWRNFDDFKSLLRDRFSSSSWEPFRLGHRVTSRCCVWRRARLDSSTRQAGGWTVRSD